MSVEPVDVLIITAAEIEDEAVRAVSDGALGPWQETEGPPGYGFRVWLRSFVSGDGVPLRVALTRSYEMGEAAGVAAGQLIGPYNPQCLAMCGVCAGNPGRTKLGDVIVADRVYRYDAGSVENPGPDGKPVFHADTMTFPFKAQWTQAAQYYRVPADAAWLAERPRTRDLQAFWVLREVLEGRDALTSTERPKFCADWTEVLQTLVDDKLLVLKGGKLQLTKGGEERILNQLTLHGGKLPEQDDWKIVVGPMGTGNNLVKDVTIWDRLEIAQRHIAGLDMEGSIIGLAAHIHNVPYVVVKGVMDYAEPGRTQGFRKFAARASAEVLLGFLRKHLKPHGVGLAEVLRSGTADLPKTCSPSALLNARYQVVDFFDAPRQHELGVLEKWCEDSVGVSVRLFVGPGGAGKTRLLMEWCERLNKRGWRTGFLRERPTEEDLQSLVACPSPLFIVIDYAEARSDLLELLRRVGSRRVDGHLPTRVALLARDVADWWQVLLRQDGELAGLLTEYEPLRLEEVALEGGLRLTAFSAACQAFAKLRECSVPTACPDLSDDRFGRMLYLHMAALAMVDELPVSADSLLEEVLAHEERFWWRHFREQNPSTPLDFAALTTAARRTIAALTLLGGQPDLEAVEVLIGRVSGLRAEHFPRFLHWLYPGSGRIGDQGAYVGSLEPDLLGEALVAKVLSDLETPRGYLESVLQNADDVALENAFRVLGRLETRYPEAAAWIEQALATNVPRRAPAALSATLSLGEETASASLGIILAAVLEREGTVDMAKAFENALPEETVSLREVAVWVACRLLEGLPRGQTNQDVLQERVRLLNSLASRLTALGRREDALKATREAVVQSRTLVDQHHDAFLPDLAMSLNNLSLSLSDLGQWKEAFEAAREAVHLYRTLIKQCRDVFLPGLAVGLNSLGARLNDLGRREEALEVAREAVGHSRELAEKWPNAFLPDLARSLNNVSNVLTALGRREEAVEAAREALDLRRTLAQQRPDAFLPGLALSLNTLANTLSDLGQRDEAFEAAREAAELCRSLAKQRPRTFLSDLAMSLNNLSNRLSEVGRPEEAIEVGYEAVELYRSLTKQHPDAFLPDFARSLSNVGVKLSGLGRWEEALEVVREAVEHHRTLAKQPSGAFLPDLAASLSNLGIILSALARREEAIEAARDAVEICAVLAEQTPMAFLHHFKMCLGSLMRRLQESGRAPQSEPAVIRAMKTLANLKSRENDGERG
jgi:tetratricopeptide (TPR) repeat protein/nucleoside phosphorylase